MQETCIDHAGQTLKFRTEIGRTVAVQEAQRAGQTIMQYQGDHPVADEYRAWAKEFEERLAVIRQKPGVAETGEVANA